MAISKSRRGSCFSSRNRNWLLSSPLDLHLGRLLFLALLASCSALAIESSTPAPEVSEATTIIPAHIEEIAPTPAPINQNETTTAAHPVEDPKDAADPVAAVLQSSAAEVPDSFVSVYGGTLEQDIKNDVNSEVEESPAPEEPTKETVPTVAEVAEVQTENRETEALQNAREPKTLEAEEEERKPAEDIAPEDQPEPETVTDNIALSSEQAESRSRVRPLPPVTSDLVSVILNEDRAITEQPITKTNLLALEQEHEALESESTSTPVPIYEEPKHQVTKKQGVEDLLPIEVAPEVVDEPETDREQRQFEEPNPNLNEIDGNTSEGDKVIPTTLLKSAVELQETIERKTEEEAKAEIEEQVEGTAPPQETVVEAADSEDTQPEEESVSEEPNQKEKNEEPIEKQLKEAEPKEEEPKEEEPKEKELKVEEENLKEEQPKEEELKVEEENPKEEQPKEEELRKEEPKEEKPKEAEAKEEELKEEEPHEEVTIHQIDAEEPIVLASPSSTEKPVNKNDGESVEDKEEKSESVEDKEDEDKDSSEETQEPAADEAKPSSSDDSTATPLVSYPPHDAGQTFDSNSADEHSAQLSGPSNYRSTLIIALCSGTAVIFIVASLVIFVVSFQRQHGTLDIEMQEQRLGKDDRDEEDAQVKLLEVDLSTPVIVSLGNEETDECL